MEAMTPALRARPGPRITGLAVALIAGATALTAVLLPVLAGPDLVPPVQLIVVYALGALLLVLAVIVARGAPDDPTGPLLAAQGLIVVTTTSTPAPPPLWDGTWMLLYVPLALILVVTPTGRAASPRWRTAALALCAVVLLFILVSAAAALIVPTPTTALQVVGMILLAAFFGLLVACAAAPFARYRHSDESDQQRVRWILAAGLSLPLTLLLCWASYLVLGGPELVDYGLITMLTIIPIGATIALVRPRLFDVDRAIVGITSVLVVAAAALAVLSVASIAAGSSMDGWPPVAAATAAAVVTLGGVVAFPFVRRVFDRMLYPERARTVARLRRLSLRVDAGSAPPEQLQAVLREGLRDPDLVVAYRRPSDGDLVGMDGRPVTASERSATVRIRGEEIGLIVPSVDRVRPPAAAIARASAPLLDAVRSRSELARAAAEAEASRERLLRAGYEERRRLERDLHDGAQQRLVAIGMRLRVLQRTATPGGEVSETLDAVVAELGTAVSELRRLAHGVRPGSLDDGLGAALAELGRLSPETVELDVRAGELPDSVATTAYFVVSEAVANALRHSGATRVRVVVRHEDDALQLRVSDDGRGGASANVTGGLTGLSDRVAALGGRLQLHSPIGAGTTIEVVLPCVS